jgi:hypothetical protein
MKGISIAKLPQEIWYIRVASRIIREVARISFDHSVEKSGNLSATVSGLLEIIPL